MYMKTQHTQREWYYDSLGRRIRGGNQGIICELVRGIKTDQEIEANAKLIAAAPVNLDENIKTLNLLKIIVKHLPANAPEEVFTKITNRVKGLNQAIKKATEL